MVTVLAVRVEFVRSFSLSISEPKVIADSCPKKADLIVQLREAHTRIVALHDIEVEHLLRGELGTDTVLEAELHQARSRRNDIVEELKVHIVAHGC